MSVGLIYVVSVFDHYLKMHLNSNQLIKSSVKDVYSPRKKKSQVAYHLFWYVHCRQ